MSNEKNRSRSPQFARFAKVIAALPLLHELVSDAYMITQVGIKGYIDIWKLPFLTLANITQPNILWIDISIVLSGYVSCALCLVCFFMHTFDLRSKDHAWKICCVLAGIWYINFFLLNPVIMINTVGLEVFQSMQHFFSLSYFISYCGIAAYIFSSASLYKIAHFGDAVDKYVGAQRTICSSCGAVLADDDNFCYICGSKALIEEPMKQHRRNDIYAWLLAIAPIPMSYWLNLLFSGSPKQAIVSMGITFLLNSAFVILDLKELKRSEVKIPPLLMGAAFIFVPIYLFARSVQTKSAYMAGVIWCALFTVPMLLIHLGLI